MDRDELERRKPPELREGFKHLMVLPDEGPWSLMIFKGRVLTVSQVSGLYEIEGMTLRKIELKDGTKA